MAVVVEGVVGNDPQRHLVPTDGIGPLGNGDDRVRPGALARPDGGRRGEDLPGPDDVQGFRLLEDQESVRGHDCPCLVGWWVPQAFAPGAGGLAGRDMLAGTCDRLARVSSMSLRLVTGSMAAPRLVASSDDPGALGTRVAPDDWAVRVTHLMGSDLWTADKY